jgi:hypothetical protein
VSRLKAKVKSRWTLALTAPHLSRRSPRYHNFARRRRPRRRASFTAGTCRYPSLRRKPLLPPLVPRYNSRKRRKRSRKCPPGCMSWALVPPLSSYDSPTYERHRGDAHSHGPDAERRKRGHALTEVTGSRSTRRITEIRRWRGSPRTRILQRRLRAKDDTERSRADTRDAVRSPDTPIPAGM